jgi:fructokinase
MNRVIAIGETTYDIVFKNGQPNFAVVGGSMLNTAVSLARVGVPVSFVSRIGFDLVGSQSCQFLTNEGIDIQWVTRFFGNSRIALAFLDDDNNANYQFYKEENAPTLVYPYVGADDWVLFGSTHAVADEGRVELLAFLDAAHKMGAYTVYDPNIRAKTEAELEKIRIRFEENLRFTKILKGSDEDFQKLYGDKTPRELFSYFRAFGIEWLFVTAGSTCNTLVGEQFELTCPVQKINALSTIGAGDNFTAGMLYGCYLLGIQGTSISDIQKNEGEQLVKMGAQFAANVCLSAYNYIDTTFANELNSENL